MHAGENDELLVIMYFVLCYTKWSIAVSSAFMFFSEQFNAYTL